MKQESLDLIRERAIKTLNSEIDNFYSFNELTYNKKENRFYLGKLDLHNGYGVIFFNKVLTHQTPFITGYIYSDYDGNWFLRSLSDYPLNKFKDNYIGAVLSQHTLLSF